MVQKHKLMLTVKQPILRELVVRAWARKMSMSELIDQVIVPAFFGEKKAE